MHSSVGGKRLLGKQASTHTHTHARARVCEALSLSLSLSHTHRHTYIREHISRTLLTASILGIMPTRSNAITQTRTGAHARTHTHDLFLHERRSRFRERRDRQIDRNALTEKQTTKQRHADRNETEKVGGGGGGVGGGWGSAHVTEEKTITDNGHWSTWKDRKGHKRSWTVWEHFLVIEVHFLVAPLARRFSKHHKANKEKSMPQQQDRPLFNALFMIPICRWCQQAYVGWTICVSLGLCFL